MQILIPSLGWSLRFGISNMLPVGDVADVDNDFWTTL